MTLRPVEPDSIGRWRRRRPAPSGAAPADAADLYRRLAPPVLGYLRSQAAPDPEDLLGEIFLQVVRDLSRFEGDDVALRRWVFSIAHHRVIDARRRAGRRPVIDNRSVPDLVAAPSPPDPLDAELVQALRRLTADQREVVALRFVADLPIDTVAAITGRTANAVKSLQHRALDALARELGDDWPSVSAAGA